MTCVNSRFFPFYFLHCMYFVYDFIIIIIIIFSTTVVCCSCRDLDMNVRLQGSCKWGVGAPARPVGSQLPPAPTEFNICSQTPRLLSIKHILTECTSYDQA